MSNDGTQKGGSIYLADGGLHRNGEAPPLSVSSHVAQMAEMDRRNKILKAHADKCEMAAKHFAGKLDAIAKARQVYENDLGEDFKDATEKFIDAIDKALEKSFIPEPPAK